MGKTLLAKTIAQSISGVSSRIQFTPDLLPTDITGTSIFDLNQSKFEFVPGPVFSNIVLADEMNRTGPRTQSALLEAMGEQQVTVDGARRPLPSPFMVIATENLIESHGTFPLPNSQLDRFPDFHEHWTAQRSAGDRDTGAVGARPPRGLAGADCRRRSGDAGSGAGSAGR